MCYTEIVLLISNDKLMCLQLMVYQYPYSDSSRMAETIRIVARPCNNAKLTWQLDIDITSAQISESVEDCVGSLVLQVLKLVNVQDISSILVRRMLEKPTESVGIPVNESGSDSLSSFIKNIVRLLRDSKTPEEIHRLLKKGELQRPLEDDFVVMWDVNYDFLQGSEPVSQARGGRKQNKHANNENSEPSQGQKKNRLDGNEIDFMTRKILHFNLKKFAMVHNGAFMSPNKIAEADLAYEKMKDTGAFEEMLEHGHDMHGWGPQLSEAAKVGFDVAIGMTIMMLLHMAEEKNLTLAEKINVPKLRDVASRCCLGSSLVCLVYDYSSMPFVGFWFHFKVTIINVLPSF